MLVSTNWVKEFVDLNGINIRELIQQFTLSTAEVEEVYEKGRNIQNVVVAEIVEINNVEKSNKLHLLTLDTGNGFHKVVCGAPNIAVGKKVPLALPGGQIPAGKINECTIMGIRSAGVCCSEADLDLGDDNSGLMDIPVQFNNGTDIKEIFDIDDVVFEVDNKSLTNRPDLWGIYGIAREFSALAKRELLPLPVEKLPYAKDEFQVDIRRTDLVYRYSCVKIENVNVKMSPINMRIRLHYCGLRAINLLADLTNYIMLELGQPMHAFDGNKIQQIRVDTPLEPFEFKTLDGQIRTIQSNMLMIYNGDVPVAIAGIMGGYDSEINNDTTSFVLESANFDGVSVRKSSAALGLRTDASMRYEKILDPELTTLAIERLYTILKRIDNNIIVSSQVIDKYLTRFQDITIEIDNEYIKKYTGIVIDDKVVEQTLKSLGFGVKNLDGNYTVKVPSWRATKDVTIKADLIEEIARIYGYDNFDVSTTKSKLEPVEKNNTQIYDEAIKDILVERYNMHEVHSYIWNDAKKINKIGIEVEENPYITNLIGSENSILRKSMIPTLLSFVYDNKTFKDEFSIFEIGRVIDGVCNDGSCNERKHLGIVFYSRVSEEKAAYLKFFSLFSYIIKNLKRKECRFEFSSPKSKWQHPKNISSIFCDEVELGYICTLHPKVLHLLDKSAIIICAEMDVGKLYSIVPDIVSYIEPSKYPSVDYDLSLVLPENIVYANIAETWKNVSCDFLRSVKIIDEYRRDDLHSCTIRFHLQAQDRTLTSNEVQDYIDKIISNLQKINVFLRS